MQFNAACAEHLCVLVGVFVVLFGHDYIAVAWLDRAVNHKQVVFVDTSVNHGVAATADGDGGCWVADEVFIKI